MPITATATASPDGTYVILTASGGVAPYVWTAYPTGLPAYPVPAADAYPDGSTTFDGFLPFGRSVLYQVRDATSAVDDTPPITLPDPERSVLSDALDPTRSLAVTVVDQLPNEWQGRSVWFDVIDRRDPFVATAPMRLRGGTLALRTETADERLSLLALLADGSPLILRSPCHDAVDDVVMLADRVTESLIVESDKTGPRRFDVAYQAVTRELGPYVADPLWDWALLVADTRNPSWSVVGASFASWDDVVSNVRRP